MSVIRKAIMDHPRGRRPLHYAFLILLSGVLTLFAALGLGRFALGMLLPSMSEGLSLSYVRMGVIGTGNFIGYLVGVLICGLLVRRLGARLVIFCGLLAVALSMMLIGILTSYPAVLASYIVTGLGSGLANIAMMGLVAHWFLASRRGRAAGIFVMGNGLGIMLSGALIPFLNDTLGSSGWRAGWLVMGTLVLLAAMVCGPLLRNDPSEMNLSPLGDGSPREHRALPVHSRGSLWPLIAHLGAIYLLFGFTYVIYATFIVTTLVQDFGFSEASSGRLWIWLGFISLFSGPLFGGLSDRIGRRAGMLIVFFLQTCAYLPVGLQLPGLWIHLSIFLFGLVVWSIPSILTATLGDYLPQAKITTALGYITFIFGIGQITGPTLAGLLAEKSGGFHAAYLLAAAMTALAFLLVLFLRPPPAAESDSG